MVNLQEAIANIVGPYLVPGSDFIGVAAGMVKCGELRSGVLNQSNSRGAEVNPRIV
jgi:hypothetical protein